MAEKDIWKNFLYNKCAGFDITTDWNKYHCDSFEGRGGMAVVYSATPETPNGLERVAVKISKEKFAAMNNISTVKDEVIDPVYDESMRREQDVLTLLNHPNIVSVVDVADGVLVMERMGMNAEELLAVDDYDGDKDFFHDCLQTGISVAKTLDYIHNKGFIYRDMNPRNIMYRKDNSVALVDFGLTLYEGEELEKGVVVGTPTLMAPEQISGTVVDRRIDIYSLGMVLIRFLSFSETPFGDTDITSFTAMYRARFKDPLYPSAYNTAVPEELSDVLMKAAHKDYKYRYETAAEFADELSKFL